MRVIIDEGIRLEVDAEGFLSDSGSWSEDMARILAAREGIMNLTEDHFNILRFLRVYHGKNGTFPILRALCRSVHQPRTCVTDKFTDPVTAWKIAGLPNPGEEVIGFRSWEPLGF